MENLKQTTELVRKALLSMANRKNPFDNMFSDDLIHDIGINNSLKNDFINYLYKCHLVYGDNSTLPKLSEIGMQLAQDIANDEIWNEAMKICDENKVYSMNTVLYAVRSIIKNRIDSALNK